MCTTLLRKKIQAGSAILWIILSALCVSTGETSYDSSQQLVLPLPCAPRLPSLGEEHWEPPLLNQLLLLLLALRMGPRNRGAGEVAQCSEQSSQPTLGGSRAPCCARRHSRSLPLLLPALPTRVCQTCAGHRMLVLEH